LGMKQLLIIRHAKSSWAVQGQNDFDRPLNERGQRDAPMMAQRLFDKHVAIDAFISSTANRALTTAYYFAETYQIPKKSIIQFRELYHAPASVFYNVISKLDDKINAAGIFSHNPGITEFVNLLTTTRVDDMPTCAVFAVEADISQWKEFKSARKVYWFFDYPKL